MRKTPSAEGIGSPTGGAIEDTPWANSRMGAQFLVQNNAFRSTKDCITTTGDSPVDGFVNQSGNDFGGCVNDITQTGNCAVGDAWPQSAAAGVELKRKAASRKPPGTVSRRSWTPSDRAGSW